MKTVFKVFAVVGVFMFLWMSVPDNGVQDEEHAVEASAANESPTGNSSAPSDREFEEPSENADVDKSQKISRNPEFVAWLQQNGFTNEYNIFFTNREFLESQAALGDMLAEQMLGYQMSGSARGNELLTNAARRGSIQALHFLSSSTELVADGRLKEQREKVGSEYDQHEYALKALEYLFVAEMRGDTYAAPDAIARLMDRFSYSEADISQACRQAGERYDALEKSRMADGMPAFDNAPPPGMALSPTFKGHCP